MELDDNLNSNLSVEKMTIENYSFDKCVDDLFNFVETLNLKVESVDERVAYKKQINEFLLDYFSEIKKDIVFDLKDHFDFDGMTYEKASIESGSHVIKYIMDSSFRRWGFSYNFEKLDREDFKKTMLNDEELFMVSDATNCSKCNCYVSYAFDMKELKIKGVDNFQKLEPCSIKKEIEYKLNLNIPSGKIVFTNYFRGLLDDDKYRDNSLGTYKGLIAHARDYEKDNIGYMYVGNSSPSIYIDEKKKNIIAANYYVLEEYDGYKEDNALEEFFENYEITKSELKKIQKKLNGFTEIGRVSTSLWAVTFMDYDQFKEALDKKGLNEKNYNQDFFVVEIDGSKIEVETNNIEYKNGDKDHEFSIKVKK